MICTGLCHPRKSIVTAKKVKLPRNITVTDHFTDLIQQGKVNGDKAALIGNNGVTLWTPMQLDLTANRLAKAMRRLLGYWTNNNPDGDLVIGFCLHTTENVILMMLAILKLGGTYLSLLTTYPEQQILKIVDVTRPLLIVTESNAQILSRFDCVKHLCSIAHLNEIIENSQEFEGDPNDPVCLESLAPPWRRAACIVLTAGTTGTPGCVRIGHLSILNRLYWQYKAIPYTEGEISCLSSHIVDVESVAEILAPLLAGVKLHIIPMHEISRPERLLRKIQEIKISRITMTPSNINAMLKVMEELGVEESKIAFSSVLHLIISGDVFTIPTGLKCFQYMDPKCELVYFYGATETMSEATYWQFKDENDFKEKARFQQVSAGLPLYNSTIYIMDEDLNILPEGEIGEISVSGKCLAMGYSNAKEIVDRFIMYPPGVKKSRQIKLFRTGDFGKIIYFGGERLLYYEGRIDMTMKIHGEEFELSLIEVAVLDTKLCTDCAVLCYGRNREDQTAVAFCVLNDEATKEDLVEVLKKVLQDQYIPDVYPVTELPFFMNGRLDRQKLLKAYKFRRMESTPEEWKALNMDIAEKQAAKVLFAAISHTIGLTLRFVMSNYQSSFWTFGGNSLNALVIVQICREKGYMISIDDFILAESISQIAKIMVESSKNPVTNNIMLLHLCDQAQWKYEIGFLKDQQKLDVIKLLSKCYGESALYSLIAEITQEDYTKYIEVLWDDIVKQNLGVFATEKETGKIVAAAFCTDVNARRVNLSRKRIGTPMSYYVEIMYACEAIVRQTTINKERGKIINIFMMGTDTSVETRFNVLLIEFLLKSCMQRALLRGYSWTLIMSESPIIRDLCGSILQYDVIAEVKLNSFVSKDKTKPFRKARDYQSVKAYYRLFT